MNIKPNTYYKMHYKYGYNIIYNDDGIWIYDIATKRKDKPLVKYDRKFWWGRTKEFIAHIRKHNIKVEEITTEDLFLELL